MDGENNGKPYEQMDDLGGKPTIFGNIHIETKDEFAETWWHLLVGESGEVKTKNSVDSKKLGAVFLLVFHSTQKPGQVCTSDLFEDD